MQTNLAAVAAEPAEVRMRLQGLLERVASTGKSGEEPVLGPYLTISREAESGGAEVAREVSQRIGWQVLDSELVQNLAKSLELEPRLLELMDETRVNWFSETLLNLFESRLVLQDSYVSLLSRGIALAAYDGPVIIVGRGAHLVLPPGAGLRVRVVAHRSLRVQALAEREGLDEKTAGHRLDAIDHSRTEFVRRHFHNNPADATSFDMVVNSGTFGLKGSADLICRALEQRGLIS
jgi:cytidylate kinase